MYLESIYESALTKRLHWITQILQFYTCALNRKGLPVQGRLLLTQKYACFYGWTSDLKLQVPFTEIMKVCVFVFTLFAGFTDKCICSLAKIERASFFFVPSALLVRTSAVRKRNTHTCLYVTLGALYY
jgi:hypothetical protein